MCHNGVCILAIVLTKHAAYSGRGNIFMDKAKLFFVEGNEDLG